MPLDYNPLTDTHCDICTKILADIEGPIEIVKKCIDCGFPAQDMLDELNRVKTMAQKVKVNFFPHRP